MNIEDHNKIYTNRYYKKHYDIFREFEKPMGESIFKMLSPLSLLDLGCGIGSFLEGAVEAGCEDIWGIDLSYDNIKDYLVDCIYPYIEEGDILNPLYLGRKYECVMSFEVGEHIEPESTWGFIDNLVNHSSKYIILTAAPPGQRGTCHINLREKEFWIKEIESHNFKHQQDLVDKFKEVWKDFVPAYLINNLMVFKKEE